MSVERVWGADRKVRGRGTMGGGKRRKMGKEKRSWAGVVKKSY